MYEKRVPSSLTGADDDGRLLCRIDKDVNRRFV